jgi:hypothetical protein
MSMEPIERTLIDGFGAGACSVLTCISAASFGIASEPSVVAGLLTAMFASNAVIHARKLSRITNQKSCNLDA